MKHLPLMALRGRRHVFGHNCGQLRTNGGAARARTNRKNAEHNAYKNQESTFGFSCVFVESHHKLNMRR